MNKKILFLILLGVLVVPTVVFGQNAGANTKLTDITDNLAKAAIAVGTAIVVIGWIIAGILYLTASGKPEKITIAKQAMIACVIGTLLVVLAQGAGAIKSVISSAFFGSSSTTINP